MSLVSVISLGSHTSSRQTVGWRRTILRHGSDLAVLLFCCFLFLGIPGAIITPPHSGHGTLHHAAAAAEVYGVTVLFVLASAGIFTAVLSRKPAVQGVVIERCVCTSGSGRVIC